MMLVNAVDVVEDAAEAVVVDSVLDVVVAVVADSVLDVVVDNVLGIVVDNVLTAGVALAASIAGGVVLESSSLAQKGNYLRRKDCPCIICCRGPLYEINIRDK
jgi:hypothetical protein